MHRKKMHNICIYIYICVTKSYGQMYEILYYILLYYYYY